MDVKSAERGNGNDEDEDVDVEEKGGDGGGGGQRGERKGETKEIDEHCALFAEAIPSLDGDCRESQTRQSRGRARLD